MCTLVLNTFIVHHLWSMKQIIKNFLLVIFDTFKRQKKTSYCFYAQCAGFAVIRYALAIQYLKMNRRNQSFTLSCCPLFYSFENSSNSLQDISTFVAFAIIAFCPLIQNWLLLPRGRFKKITWVLPKQVSTSTSLIISGQSKKKLHLFFKFTGFKVENYACV